jgi:tetratricopeptide (TPR) repeat protein
MEWKRVAVALLLGSGLLFGKGGGLAINPQELEEIIAKNPNDVANRLLLAKYYIQQDQLEKAEEYIQQAKKIDPQNRLIKVLEQQLEAERKRLQAIQQVLQPIREQYGSIDNYITDLFRKGKYKEIIDFYLKYGKYLHLSDSSLIKIAKIFDWEGKYRQALWVLRKIKDKTSLDYYTIRADVAFNTQDMKTAIKYYRILFSITGDPLFGKRLAQLYIWNGDLERAQKVLLILKRRLGKGKGKPDKELQKLWEEVQKKKREYIERIKKIYEQNPSFANLQRYVYAVADKNLSKGIPIVIEHIKRHPEDGDAKFFLAKLYAWTNQYDKAVQYLRKLKGNKEAELLLAQILSWQGKYPEAERIFKRLAKDSNRTIGYQAEKGLGLIYSWTGRKEEAIKIFEKLHKENPKDKEVNVQLILLKGTPKQLIAYYRSLLKKNPKDGEALLGLGDLYFRLKKYHLAAKYYEKYLMLYPNKLEVYKMLGDAYLQLKNFYKGFSNWEYYAYMKGTKEAYLELAKRYYWYGFNNEALKVLDDLLARYPKFKEARLLKAKILKVNPRFVVASSAATFEQYLGNRSKKLLALGDRAYFNGFYATAAQYYKELLLWNPENYDVREKYAYSLEHIGDYKTAAGEFFLLMWMKKDPKIVYNYAFCLQKSGKLKQAEKVYKELLNQVARPAPQFIVQFLEEWKKAFESMDSYQLAKFYSKKLAQNPRWRFKKDQFFQKQVWVALSFYDPVLLGVEEKGDKKIYKVRFWEILATKYIHNRGRYRYLWIECPSNLEENLTTTEGRIEIKDQNRTIASIEYQGVPLFPVEECKIVKERIKSGKFEKFDQNRSIYHFIQQNLYWLKKKENSLFPLK